MKTTRSLAAVCLFATMFAALIGCGKIDEEYALMPNVPEAEFGPLTYLSETEFAEAVANAESGDYDTANLAEIDFYYRPPSELIEDATLETINVKDLYVALYYYFEEIDETKYDTPAALDAARVENTIKLEWIRRENGEEWLANDIENLSLRECGNGVYYCDIVYPDYSDRILAKSFFWVQDGYLVDMDVPQKLIDAAGGIHGIKLDIERVDIAK